MGVVDRDGHGVDESNGGEGDRRNFELSSVGMFSKEDGGALWASDGCDSDAWKSS